MSVLPLAGLDTLVAQDFFAPDSAYYLPFEFKPIACTGEILVQIPIYLWTDDYASFYGVRFRVSGYTGCDSAIAHFFHPCGGGYTHYECNDGDSLTFGAACNLHNYLTPGSGVAGEFFIRGLPGDTISLNLNPPLRFTVSDYSNYWFPAYTRLDTQFVIPTVFDIASGDADASGVVTISDAVFLIQYIFNGGCAPYDADSADPNADCLVSISDAVHLINYIFLSGAAPLPGCANSLPD